MRKNKMEKVLAAKSLALTRISIGLVFLWAFFDKLIGLGFTTCKNPDTGATNVLCEKAWAMGGSPTESFLTFATKGPFEGLFSSLAGIVAVDVLFMAGLLGVGVGLTFGIAKKLSGYAGALMLVLMWLAALPPENHPFVDDHVVYALILVFIANSPNTIWSYQNRFAKTKIGKTLNVD